VITPAVLGGRLLVRSALGGDDVEALPAAIIDERGE
jgi:hypothetical protein